MKRDESQRVSHNSAKSCHNNMAALKTPVCYIHTYFFMSLSTVLDIVKVKLKCEACTVEPLNQDTMGPESTVEPLNQDTMGPESTVLTIVVLIPWVEEVLWQSIVNCMVPVVRMCPY